MMLADGQLWTLEEGEAYAFLQSLPSDSVDGLVTDPPYSSGGFMRGDRMADPIKKYVDNRAEGRDYAVTFDGDNRDGRAFLSWATLWLSEAYRVLRPGSPAVVFSDWRQLPTMTDAIQCGGFAWRGISIWSKDERSRPQMGRFRADSEFMVWGTKGPSPDLEGVGCLPGLVMAPPVDHRTRLHPTEKPVPVMEHAVAIVRPGGIVLDPFAGSGTTGVAALRTGRRALLVESSGAFAALARERIAADVVGSSVQAARAGQSALFDGGSDGK